MAWHTQVPFKTIDGETVEIDTGLFEILTLLKWLGVKSLYSCQGSDYEHKVTKRKIHDQAYILVRTRGAKRLERQIIRGFNRGAYSLDTMETIALFLKGKREFEASVFSGERSEYRIACYRRIFGDKKSKYLIERSISNKYGSRTTYRWPHEDNERIRKALAEIVSSQKLQGL